MRARQMKEVVEQSGMSVTDLRRARVESFQDFIAFSFRLHSLRNCDMGGLPVGNSSESKLEQGSVVVKSTPDGKPKKKICCACPDTKKLRDECIVEHGEEFCGKWIEAHLAVLATAGVAAALVIVLGRWDVHVYGVKVAAEPRDSLLDARAMALALARSG
ncbi:Cytochrome c oxidase copper chaperone 2, partial [Cucurbita argyrosperma subsp. argyrosperma]